MGVGGAQHTISSLRVREAISPATLGEGVGLLRGLAVTPGSIAAVSDPSSDIRPLTSAPTTQPPTRRDAGWGDCFREK